MSSLFGTVDGFIKKTLWGSKAASSQKGKKFLIAALRLLYKIGQEFSDGEILRRASSLVYTTLLSLVPVLAVSFSVLKAFGVHTMLEPFMRDFLAPLGDKGDEITSSIIGYVDRINVGILGAVGLATLLYTVMNTIQQVENSFNYLWHIREKRNLLRRFRDYMSVLLVGPVLTFSALGITTSVMSNAIAQRITSMEPFGTALFLMGKLVPYVLMSMAFTLMYYLLPYTKVSLLSACVGGVSGGILWEAGSWTFAHVVMSSAQYSAVYSGFAIVLLFMIWLYYNWIILLIGVKVSFYHQFPALLSMRDDRTLYSEWYMQRLAIVLMYLIGYNYSHGGPRWTLSALTARLCVPMSALQDILMALEKNGLILRVDPDHTFVPARDIGTITLAEVVRSIRGEIQDKNLLQEDCAAFAGIERIMSGMENVLDRTLSAETVKVLISPESHGPTE
jgi:membrane protein